MNLWIVGEKSYLEAIPLETGLVLAAVFFALAVIILISPTIVNWWQRWRGKQPTRPTEGNQGPITPLTAKREHAVLANKPDSTDVLGWGGNKKTEVEEAAVESENVLGRGKTILIADDDPVVVLALSQRLRNLGYQVVRSPDATHALLGIKKIRPDLVILDIQMPSGNGLAVCEMLACDRECANIPIVVHSILGEESIKKRCHQLGTYYVEKSPRSWLKIKKLVESLLGEHKMHPSDTKAATSIAGESPVAGASQKIAGPMEDELYADLNIKGDASPTMQKQDVMDADISQKMVVPLEKDLHSVLCIDDDPLIIRAIAMRLQPYGIKVKGADNGTQGYMQAATDPPDLIVLDLKMPNGAGNYTIGKLKDNPKTKHIPVIVLTMETTAGVQRLLTSLGADGFLTKPVHWPELFATMGRCVQLPRQLQIDYHLQEQLTVHGL
jgi:CheY-like chemotaxis protein